MILYCNGITVDVPANEVAFYKRCGYVEVKNEPVTTPAQERQLGRPRKSDTEQGAKPEEGKE